VSGELTEREPAVRATYLRLLLERADELVPGAIRPRLGDAELTAIECAGPLAWLPVTTDLALQRALADTLGPERLGELLRSGLRAVWASTPIRGIVQAAVGLLGVHPGTLARLVPNAWMLLYRNCGRWSVEPHPPAPLASSDAPGPGREQVLLRLDELPASCTETAAWLEAVATMLHAMLILCDVEGEVELVAREARSGEAPRSSALFRMRWSP
jgi:hypothetical protein